MTRLHEFSTRLLSKAELQPLLEEALNAIIALQNADFGKFSSTTRRPGRYRSSRIAAFNETFWITSAA